MEHLSNEQNEKLTDLVETRWFDDVYDNFPELFRRTTTKEAIEMIFLIFEQQDLVENKERQEKTKKITDLNYETKQPFVQAILNIKIINKTSVLEALKQYKSHTNKCNLMDSYAENAKKNSYIKQYINKLIIALWYFLPYYNYQELCDLFEIVFEIYHKWFNHIYPRIFNIMSDYIVKNPQWSHIDNFLNKFYKYQYHMIYANRYGNYWKCKTIFLHLKKKLVR